MKNYVILISGRGSNMEALLAANLPGRCAAVISNRPDAAGLGHARDHGVATAVIDHRAHADRAAFDAALAAEIERHAPDLVLLAGFMRVLGDDVVRRFSGRMLNIHPSLLPAFPGMHTHRAALAAGVRIHGCTVHFVTPALDRGPIVIQAAVPVLDGDDEATLSARVLAQEHLVYPEAARWFLQGMLRIDDGRVRVDAAQSGGAALRVPGLATRTMKRRGWLAACVSLLAMLAPIAAGAMPVAGEAAVDAPSLARSGRIQFSVARGTDGFVVGQNVHEWRHDGVRYRLTSTLRTTGLAALFKAVKVTQVSEGLLLRDGLRPDRFRTERGGEIATASLDWKARQVRFGDGGMMPLVDGAQDLLSVFYQLGLADRHGEGATVAVTNGRKLEAYAVEWLGEEILSLKPGRFHAVHVRIRATDGGKDTTEVWLGREAAGLPVRMRFIDRKGDVSELVAEKIDYEGR